MPSVYIQSCDCLTPLGSSQVTTKALLEGKIGLYMQPVLGEVGGDDVPLATFETLSNNYPPRWLPHLDKLVKRIPNAPWGEPAYPIIVTSSNFGIGQLYAFSKDKNTDRKAFTLPHDCVQEIAKRYSWGKNITIITNACVSAQLGIIHASRLLNMTEIRQVLVLSYDFLSPFVTGGFHALKILNDAMPKPYTNQDSGSIGLGDGAAFAVLGRERSPFKIQKHAVHFECWHMTGNDPSGAGFQRIAESLKHELSGLHFWLKGHGTGTLEAGRLEASIFDEAFNSAPLVGWKGSLGHTLGSCGLVELAIALCAIELGKAPGSVGSSAPYFADNVQAEAFDLNAMNAFVLLSNAFAGAHTAHLIVHE